MIIIYLVKYITIKHDPVSVSVSVSVNDIYCENLKTGSLKIYANACICIYFNETFHCASLCCNENSSLNIFKGCR